MNIFCFGFGYSARALAARLASYRSVTITGTRTQSSATPLAVFEGTHRSAAAAAALAGVTHVLVSIPPAAEGCPALRHHGVDLAALQSLQWVGYLSTIGVYGDAGGAWVDEITPIAPRSERAMRRAAAETAWTAFGVAAGVRVDIFRLPGIYGPGRSAFDSLRDGTAKRLIKPGQVFNRVHVDDIAGAVHAAMASTVPIGIVNVTDDEPGPPQDVVTYAATLLGVAPPPETPFDASRLSTMGASFYAESKRVRNTRLKADLGYRLAYPTYREGLRAILAAGG